MGGKLFGIWERFGFFFRMVMVVIFEFGFLLWFFFLSDRADVRVSRERMFGIGNEVVLVVFLELFRFG